MLSLFQSVHFSEGHRSPSKMVKIAPKFHSLLHVDARNTKQNFRFFSAVQYRETSQIQAASLSKAV